MVWLPARPDLPANDAACGSWTTHRTQWTPAAGAADEEEEEEEIERPDASGRRSWRRTRKTTTTTTRTKYDAETALDGRQGVWRLGGKGDEDDDSKAAAGTRTFRRIGLVGIVSWLRGRETNCCT